MPLLLVLCCVTATLCGQDSNAVRVADLATLTRDVTSLPVHGSPGPVVPLSGEAFPVVTAGKPRERAALVVAARVDAGRVVAFGHGGYLSAGPECGVMVRNAVAWVLAERVGRVAVDGSAELVAQLRAQGIDAVRIKARETLSQLSEWKAIVVDTHSFNDSDVKPVQEYLRSGGGLVTSGLVWGWLQIRREHDPARHPGNRTLASLGLAFGDGYLAPKRGTKFDVDGAPDMLTHPVVALESLLGKSLTRAPSDRKAVVDRAAAASHTLVTAVRTVGSDDTWIRPKLESLRASRPPAVPTEAKPLDRSDPLGRVLFAMELDALDAVPSEKIRAHPAAAAFPGVVPGEAARVAREITVDRRMVGWTSTGLYAAAGAAITIQVPADAPSQGLGWRIGCHSDGIWDHDAWKRAPKVDRSGALDIGKNVMASPFGGLIYVTNSKEASVDVGVRIDGGVEAPLFVAGTTTLDAWKRLRDAPGPWAEIATSRVIITVPSSVVRTLDRPDLVAEFWVKGLDACADLAAIPHQRSRPERMVADVQISAGYMHSGYPIMTHLDVAQRFVTPKEMLDDPSKGWGFFHELGHNHQKGEWTFGGTGEVTNNLFTLYCLENVCGLKEGGHDAMDKVKSDARMRKHLDAGAPFETWKSDPFLALSMYVQLRREFGWDPFKAVFASYRDPKQGSLPKSDDEKRDQWMTRFSKQIGKNLGPFFITWGVPVSKAALAEIETLPVWMPEGLVLKSKDPRRDS